MQNSELFRRGIVLPLNSQAEEGLSCSSIFHDIQVSYLAVGEDSEFYQLWDSGVFTRINALTGACIDDYEEELVDAAQMPNVLKAIQETRSAKKQLADCVESFLTELGKLATDAKKANRPLFFVF